jgi:hypothetical protein
MEMSNEETLIREVTKWDWFQALDRASVVQDNFLENVYNLPCVENSETILEQANLIINELGNLLSLILEEEDRVKKIRKSWKKNKKEY